jgi:aconitate hydratase
MRENPIHRPQPLQEGGRECFLPFDDETLRYLRLTGRRDEHVRLVEAYCKAQRLFHEAESRLAYTRIVELDLSAVEPSLAGPGRPQDPCRSAG